MTVYILQAQSGLLMLEQLTYEAGVLRWGLLRYLL